MPCLLQVVFMGCIPPLEDGNAVVHSLGMFWQQEFLRFHVSFKVSSMFLPGQLALRRVFGN